MIRTRNFLIYVCTLVFLVSSIGYMVSRDIASASRSADTQTAFVADAPSEVAVVATEEPFDREAYIARMRDKLARGEGVIPGAPVVLTSVDAVPPVTAASPVTGRSVRWCGAPHTIHPATDAWSATDIDVRTAEGVLVVTRGTFDLSATSSADVIPQTVLLLPMRQARALQDSCIPHDTVGITLAGELIRNADAIRFWNIGAETLIGHALDGFPIYGPVSDASTLDACGGADTGAGYRYHIRTGEDFVLGCFAAPPADFLR